MTVTRIDVLRDGDDKPESDVVIRLHSAGDLPDKLSVLITPAGNAPTDPIKDGWPAAIVPREQRKTGLGVDLLADLRAFDAPALSAGTAVTIWVPEVHASTDLSWPLPRYAGTRAVGANSPGPATPVLASLPLATTAVEAAKRLNSLQAAETTSAPAGISDRPLSSQPSTPLRSDAPPRQTTERTGLTTERPRDAKLVPREPVAGAAPVRRGMLTRFRATAVSDLSALSPAVPSAHVPATAPRRRSGLSFAAGAATAAVVLGTWWAATGGHFGAPAMTLAAKAGGSYPVVTGPTLALILDVPSRSPRGVVANTVDLRDALKRADSSLADEKQPLAREEAKFWLRKALALNLGDERLTWAMAQLGTLYANPGAGEPDFKSAHVLWDLAANNGDPVAKCFLGSLYELGLGLPKDRQVALSWFEQAKSAGACPDVDAAIKRLKEGS